MIILNRIQTPDGTILTSRHRHDYQVHEDKNGEVYMVDGGFDYLRRNVCNPPAKELSVNSTDDFEKIRDGYERWNERTKKYVKLKDMSTEWIASVILYLKEGEITKELTRIMKKELKYRKDNKVKE